MTVSPPLKSIVLLFIKAPVMGQVKSRLAEDIGAEAALELYQRFLRDIIASVELSGHHCRLCYYPPEADHAVSGLLAPGRSSMPQRGDDLGARMQNAFTTVFAEGVDKAILIGSDIPDLTPKVLQDALDALDQADVVLGPALDGGYYLIGFHRTSLLPRVFHRVAWSTNAVFQKTMAILKKASRRVRIAPAWSDVDTVEDLQALFERGEKPHFINSNTMAYLRKHKDLLAQGSHAGSDSMKQHQENEDE